MMSTIACVGDDNFLKIDQPSSYLIHHLKARGARAISNGYRLPDLTFNREYLSSVEDMEYVDHRTPSPRFSLPLESTLYDFQIEAARFLRDSSYPGSLVTLRPGLGKTLTTLVAAQEFENVLVLCPRPLVEVWRAESEQWFGRDIVENASRGWSITTLETLQSRWSLFSGRPWDLVILDESSRIRNRQAKRTKAVWDIRRDAHRLWALSGFPIVSNASDLWAQLKALWPEAFSSFWRFVDDFCLVEVSTWGRVIYGSKPIDLSHAFRELIFKEPDDLDELIPHYEPESIEVPLSAEQQRAFESMRDDLIISLDSGSISTSSKLTQLIRLQQVVSSMRTIDSSQSASSKIDRVRDLVRQARVETPCLVWYHWHETGAQIYQELASIVGESNVAKIDDDDSTSVIERFQKGSLPYLVASLSIGQYGLSFTKTKTVIYVDRTFDLEKLVQSLYRPRRLGLQHRPRLITLTSPGTTDDLVQASSEGKMVAASKLAETELLRLLRAMGAK